ncbi:uncharacterized protein LOC120338442 [Styela clava]
MGIAELVLLLFVICSEVKSQHVEYQTIVIEQQARKVNGCIENSLIVQNQTQDDNNVQYRFKDGIFKTCLGAQDNTSTSFLSLLSMEETKLLDQYNYFKTKKMVLFAENNIDHNIIFYETEGKRPVMSKHFSAKTNKSEVYAILETQLLSSNISILIVGILHPNVSDHKRKPSSETSYRTDVYELDNLGLLSVTAIRCDATQNCSKVPINVTFGYNLAWDISILRYNDRFTKVYSFTQNCNRLSEDGKWVEFENHSIQPLVTRCRNEAGSVYGVKQEIKLFQMSMFWRTFFIVSKVFVGISTFFLLITVFFLVRYRVKLPSHRVFNQLGISLSFIGRQFVMLLYTGMLVAEPYPVRLCECMAILFLYFSVTTACWLLSEALVLFVKVGLLQMVSYTKAFSTRRMTAVTVCIWIFSALYVFATAYPAHRANIFVCNTNLYNAINERHNLLSSYGNSTVYDMTKYIKYYGCEPSHNDYVVYLVLTPTVIAFIFNLIVATYITTVVLRKSIATQSSRPSDNPLPTRDTIKTTTNAIIFLAWSLGIPQFVTVILNTLDHNVEAYMINIILNAVQGPIVFYFYFLKNSELRQAMKRKNKRRKLKKDNENT